MRPNKFNNKGKQKTTIITQEDLGSESVDENKIIVMGINENKILQALVHKTVTLLLLQMKRDKLSYFMLGSSLNTKRLTNSSIVGHK